MPDINWDQTEADLKQAASDRGVSYDPSDLLDIQRNASYERNQGTDPSKYYNVAIAKYDARANNEPNHPDENWGTAQAKGGGPAQTMFKVERNGSLTRNATAPPPFTIPRFGTTGGSSASLPDNPQDQVNPPASPATQAKIDAAAGRSPMEMAQAGGYLDKFQKYTEWLYADPQRSRQAAAKGVNLYDPDTWNLFGPTTNTAPAPPPAGTTPPASNPYNSSTQTRTNTSPQFTDPSQRLLEDYGLDRFHELQNPSQGSGNQLYESYAKQLVDMLKQGPYSQSDEAAIKAGAYNSINGDEQTTIQQWMEEMSRRNIQPSSGVALDGVQKIKESFNKLRASVDQQFAAGAIGMRRQDRMTALDVLGNLATSENSRLNLAEHFGRIPYDLGTDAFNQGLQMVNAGGSPAQAVQSAISLATAIQQSQQLNSQQKAQALAWLYELIGGL